MCVCVWVGGWVHKCTYCCVVPSPSFISRWSGGSASEVKNAMSKCVNVYIIHVHVHVHVYMCEYE